MSNVANRQTICCWGANPAMIIILSSSCSFAKRSMSFDEFSFAKCHNAKSGNKQVAVVQLARH